VLPLLHRLRFSSALLLPAVAALVALPAGGDPAPEPVHIELETPRPGEVVRNRVHMAPIRGAAVAEGEGTRAFDVMIAIDASGSTRDASGIDVDGDGVIGIDPRQELLPPGTYPPEVTNTDPGDSILAAEVQAALSLLEGLDPRRVRVGVLSFAGEVNPKTNERARFDQQDAWLHQPLTADYEAVRRALLGVLARGPRGATNFAAGIRLAITELAGLSGAKSSPRPDARKVVLFLTDGVPTFPIGKGLVSDPGDIDAAINAARLAHQAGITINTYGIGANALRQPVAATEMARVTRGVYTPVQSPGDIIAVLGGVSFANVEDVVLTNLTTGDFSTDVRLAPDGTFTGFVPVVEGRNRIRITALASDGSRGSLETEVSFELSGLSDRELALELERIRKRNRELQLLLERKRIDAFRKRERQRKELEIEAVE